MTVNDAMIGRAALTLDELLVDHPEHLAVLAAWAEHTAPAGLADQTAAATRDTRHYLSHLAELLGGAPASNTPAGEIPGWVRLGVFEAFTRWVAGRADTCMHAPHAARPQPVHAAAWRPHLVVCDRCTHLLGLRRGSTEDRTCDHCGRVTTGPDHGDGIHPGAVAFGPMSWQYGSCRDCRPANHDDHQASTA